MMKLLSASPVKREINVHRTQLWADLTFDVNLAILAFYAARDGDLQPGRRGHEESTDGQGWSVARLGDGTPSTRNLGT